LKRTDVSEVRTAFIITAMMDSVRLITLIMKEVCTSETSVYFN
jgi:hypothetical protein